MVDDATSSLLAEPNLSPGINAVGVRKVMYASFAAAECSFHDACVVWQIILRHAIELHGNMKDADVFRRPATDMHIDVNACIDGTRNVVNLIHGQSAGSPSTHLQSSSAHGRRSSIAKAPQVVARMLETNRVQILSRAFILIEVLSALDDELELTRLVTAHQAVQEAFKGESRVVESRKKPHTTGRKSTPDNNSQASDSACSTCSGLGSLCGFNAGRLKRGESHDACGTGFGAIPGSVHRSGPIGTISNSTCAGNSVGSGTCGSFGLAGRRSIKAISELTVGAMAVKKAAQRPHRAPSVSGASRMSDGRSSIGQSSAGDMFVSFEQRAFLRFILLLVCPMHTISSCLRHCTIVNVQFYATICRARRPVQGGRGIS